MRKTILLVLLFTGTWQVSSAQTWSEWLNQKKTQKKYLLQQIAALEVYKNFLSKGYGIVKDGTDLVGSITRGEFDLHADFFGNLKLVSAEVRQHSRAEDIVKLRQHMAQDRINMKKLIGSKPFLSVNEKENYENWYAAIAQAADKDLDELKMLLTDGTLELSDAERIKRIAALHVSMQQKYSQQRKFSNSMKGMITTRQQQIDESRALRKMYGF